MAAFSWEPHSRAVEDKRRIWAGVPTHRALTQSGIPFVVLSALLRFLEPLQRAPEDHLPEVTCDHGVASIVILVLSNLGISVLVRQEGQHQVAFGEAPYCVTVQAGSEPVRASAVVLCRAEGDGPPFTLQQAEADQHLES